MGYDIGIGIGIGSGYGRYAAGPGVGFGFDPVNGGFGAGYGFRAGLGVGPVLPLFRIGRIPVTLGLVIGPAVGQPLPLP